MTIAERFIASVKKNTNLWIGIWVLLLLNLLLVFIIAKGISWMANVLLVLLWVAGMMFIFKIARSTPDEPDVDADLHLRLQDLMEEIRPYCEEVYDKKVDRFLEPIEQDYQQRFSMGLSWLWEKVNDFYMQVEHSAQEGRSIFQLIDASNEDKMKMVERLQEGTHQVLAIMQDVQKRRFDDEDDIRKRLQTKTSEFRQSMEREKQYFYEYVYKMLLEQARTQGLEAEMAEHLSPTRLGQQFGIVVERSLENRMVDFHNSLLDDLEEFSAEVVGRFQRSTAQVLNHFREMRRLLMKLQEMSSNASRLATRRLDEYLLQISKLEEQAGETLVSLAWQDIIVEKRWDEIQGQLFYIKDQIVESVGEDSLEYVEGILNQAIPGLSSLPRDAAHALFYKALLDAELIYHVYTENKQTQVLNDGVYSLLQFLRPLELQAANSIRLTDQDLNRLRKRKNLIKKEGSLQTLFARVIGAVEQHQPSVAHYLEGIFPLRFQQFASNPYLKNNPDNLNQAAWIIFDHAIDNENLPEDFYLLVGLLLALHQIRDQYIQPFNNVPVGVKDPEEVHITRAVAYQALAILLQNDFTALNGDARNQPLTVPSK